MHNINTMHLIYSLYDKSNSLFSFMYYYKVYEKFSHFFEKNITRFFWVFTVSINVGLRVKQTFSIYQNFN